MQANLKTMTFYCCYNGLVSRTLERDMLCSSTVIVKSIAYVECVKNCFYDLRKKTLCKLPKAKRISYGVESLSFRGSFLWNTLDDNVKQDPTLVLKTK